MPRTQNTTSTLPVDAAAALRSAPEEIAARAFELYERRGGTDGADLDDWLEAERQLSEERRERLATT
jgi:hypothetical protein